MIMWPSKNDCCANNDLITPFRDNFSYMVVIDKFDKNFGWQRTFLDNLISVVKLSAFTKSINVKIDDVRPRTMNEKKRELVHCHHSK